MHKPAFRRSAAALAGLLMAAPLSVYGAGFNLIEQGPRGQGNAFAGAPAIGADASTIYFNPAAMTLLDQREIIAGMNVIDLRGDFTKEEATDVSGQPLSGGEGGNIGDGGALIPNFYYYQPISDDLHFGMGIGVPFGLATDYEADSIFRYQARRSAVSIINFNPSLAYRIDDQWSVGGGLNFHYMEVELGNAIDLGAACFGAADPTTCQDFELTPQAADMDAMIEGDGWGVGFNVGALWEGERTRVGVHYRSQVDHSLSGDARFQLEELNDTQLAAFEDLFANNGFFGFTPGEEVAVGDSGSVDVDADFKSPDHLSVGIAYELDDRWTLLGTITRMGWSVFDELVVEFDEEIAPGQDETREDQKYEDDWWISAGFDYHHSDQWTFRAGVAWDETPVQDQYRTARLPDEDRIWLAAGATWRLNPNSELDIGYTHLILDDEIPLDHTGNQGDRIVGTYEVSTNILSFQYRYLF